MTWTPGNSFDEVLDAAPMEYVRVHLGDDWCKLRDGVDGGTASDERLRAEARVAIEVEKLVASSTARGELPRLLSPEDEQTELAKRLELVSGPHPDRHPRRPSVDRRSNAKRCASSSDRPWSGAGLAADFPSSRGPGQRPTPASAARAGTGQGSGGRRSWTGGPMNEMSSEIRVRGAKCIPELLDRADGADSPAALTTTRIFKRRADGDSPSGRGRER
jgi:hypothetical protein